ncbi:MAG: GHKL domain-containing protein [Clostridium sp.]|uniref:GHKL domain-containing protein n=1 Tax=Bacillota TaxID=1239 RepID=UPI001EDD7463|nr:GHKL domain-containing protein [[Clostridium] innocuum]MCG4663186.1 GHKL domain-containing protein [[Clostridium] innocuum]MCR0442333.1 GHKL domain-containing protein [[Clostridium] innocuum]MCR0456219.1 GHKL domain-containing protein [[Clostridium] innocuum]
MEYLMVVWFLFFPFFAMGIYYFSYKQEVNEEIQELKYKYEMNQMESNLRLESYKLKLETMEKEYKYYHDLKKHLEVIRGLYTSGNDNRANMYVNELLKQSPESEYIISNDLLNIMFMDLKKKCDENNIKLITKINRRITFEKIKDIDLVIIFSNLIQNSLEAVNHSVNKTIYLEINQVHNFIVSTIKNSHSNELIYDNEIYLSTKRGHKGYGVHNIIETIEKYNGSYFIEEKDNMFHFQIILPVD